MCAVHCLIFLTFSLFTFGKCVYVYKYIYKKYTHMFININILKSFKTYKLEKIKVEHIETQFRTLLYLFQKFRKNSIKIKLEEL